MPDLTGFVSADQEAAQIQAQIGTFAPYTDAATTAQQMYFEGNQNAYSIDSNGNITELTDANGNPLQIDENVPTESGGLAGAPPFNPDLPGNGSNNGVPINDNILANTPLYGSLINSRILNYGGDAGMVSQDLLSLDPRVLGQFASLGLHWAAVPDSIDQDPEANLDPEAIPRNYPITNDDSQLTYGDLDGVFDPNLTPPVAILATSGNNVGDGSFNTLFHESGHEYDQLLGSSDGSPGGLESNSAAFMNAYNQDTNLMTPGEDDYYLNSQSGPSESFAESFSRYVGGDTTLQQDWPNMYQYWSTKFPNIAPGNSWTWSEQRAK